MSITSIKIINIAGQFLNKTDMKLNTRFITVSLVTTLFCTATLQAQPFKSVTKSKKKAPNISVNINSAINDTLKRTYLNLGLLTNIYQLNGAGLNVVSSVVRNNVYGAQVSGLANITGNNLDGVQMSGITNVNGNNMNGVSISGLVNITGQNMEGSSITGGINVIGKNANGVTLGGLMNIIGKNSNGIEISGLANVTGETTNGVAIGGLMNISGKDMQGVQISSLINITGDYTRGVQLSALANVGVDVHGVQISGLSNIAASRLSGLQLSGAVNTTIRSEGALQIALTNICLQDMRGIQLGIGNYTTEMRGAQVGLINLSEGGKVKGVQIGLVNHSKDSTSAVKIGLVNITPKTRIQMMAFGGNMTKLNVAVRFMNRISYTMLGMGTHYLGLNDKFSGSLFYRAGLYMPLIKEKLLLSGDLGYAHIENFENESVEVPERMYALQGRVNLEYHPVKKFGFFASGGYGVTRYYDRNKFYEKKPIVEFGIVLF